MLTSGRRRDPSPLPPLPKESTVRALQYKAQYSVEKEVSAGLCVRGSFGGSRRRLSIVDIYSPQPNVSGMDIMHLL